MADIKEKIIVITKSRWLPWVLIVATLVGGFFLYSHFNGMFKNELTEQQQKYERQIAGKLTEIEKQKQEFNKELGIAEAKILSEKEFKEKYKEEKEQVSKEYEAFKKKYNYKVASYEKAIADLKSKIAGGTTTVIVENNVCETEDGKKPVISYKYVSPHKRVALIDPDIFVEDNEMLEMKQRFKIYGETLVEKNGNLKTKRLVLTEVVEKEDGSYFEIGKAEIIDYKFTYTVEPPDADKRSWTERHLDLFSMMGSASYGWNSGLKFGVGVELLNFKDVGIGLLVQTDIQFDQWEKSGTAAGISYRIPKTNIGISVNVGTEFVKPFKSIYINGAIIFYIW